MAGPTIMAHGTDAQKQKHLEKILSTEEIWCQGFSEPDAGSDLSAVRTSARQDGDHFVVNGQKVWSSFAHIADWCILVTRSDPESERHAGLTYLLVDMHAPGVEVRPLRQITGEAEFNEIFFNDVEVPLENVVGEVGGGWQVAMTTLLHERGTLGFALTAALESQIQKLVALAKEKGATEVQRDAIAREWIGLQAVRYTNYRSLTTLMKTGIPGPEGSGAKLWWSEANQRVTKLALELLGPEAQVVDQRELLAAPAAALARQHDRGRHVRDPAQHHRRARARPPEDRASGVRLHPGAGGAAARGARVPRGEPRGAARATAGARLARRLRAQRSAAAAGSRSSTRRSSSRRPAGRSTRGRS